MADDWDTVTRIGSKRSGGGAGEPRERVVKAKNLNAAMRMGGVTSEKKMGSANAKPNQEGQRAAKVANLTATGAMPKIDPDITKAVQRAMASRKLNTAQLALKINEKQDIVRKILDPNGPKPDDKVLGKMEIHLGVKLRGKNLGELTKKGLEWEKQDKAAKKEEEAKEALEAKKTKTADDESVEEGLEAEEGVELKEGADSQ